MANTRGIRAGRAFVELFADDRKLVRGLRAAQRKVQAFGSQLRTMGTAVAGVGAAMLTPMLGAAKAFGSMGDQVAKMAKRTGLGVGALSELRFAASQTGTSLAAMETGLRRMQRSIYDAGRGLSTQSDALADLGLRFEDLDGLAPEDQFKRLAESISRIEDPTRKAALAQALFGRAGTQLLPMFAQGAAGIEALQAEARRLGLTMSGEDAKAAEDFTDALDRLWKVVKMGVFRVGASLAPVLRRLADTITGVATKVSEWIDQNRALVVTVAKVAAAILAGGAALAALGTLIGGVGSAMGGLATAVSMVGGMFRTIGGILSMMMTPLGAVVTLAGLLGATLLHTSGKGQAALEWLGDQFRLLGQRASDTFGAIGKALAGGDIAAAAKVLWAWLKAEWLNGTHGLRTTWVDFVAWFQTVATKGFYGLLDIVSNVFYGMRLAWQDTAGFFAKSWQVIQSDATKMWGRVLAVFDEDIDLKAFDKAVDAETVKALATIETQRDQKKGAIASEHEAVSKRLDAEKTAALVMIDADHEVKVTDAEKQLDAARKAWQDAIDAAKGGHESDTSMDATTGSLTSRLEAILADVGDTVQAAAGKATVVGTFSAEAASGLGMGSAEQRMANATEETASNTRKLLLEVRNSGTFN